jgi:hypothetical protein
VIPNRRAKPWPESQLVLWEVDGASWIEELPSDRDKLQLGLDGVEELVVEVSLLLLATLALMPDRGDCDRVILVVVLTGQFNGLRALIRRNSTKDHCIGKHELANLLSQGPPSLPQDPLTHTLQLRWDVWGKRNRVLLNRRWLLDEWEIVTNQVDLLTGGVLVRPSSQCKIRTKAPGAKFVNRIILWAAGIRFCLELSS